MIGPVRRLPDVYRQPGTNISEVALNHAIAEACADSNRATLFDEFIPIDRKGYIDEFGIQTL